MAYWQHLPGHGYLVLTLDEYRRIPDIARRYAYEEDCEWSIAVVGLPELANQAGLFGQETPGETLERTRRLCRDWYPDIFEQLTGEQATPENSFKRAEDAFARENADNWVVVSARSAEHGFVKCCATKGGVHRHDVPQAEYLVSALRYDHRSRFGYVIQSDNQFICNLR